MWENDQSVMAKRRKEIRIRDWEHGCWCRLWQLLNWVSEFYPTIIIINITSEIIALSWICRCWMLLCVKSELKWKFKNNYFNWCLTYQRGNELTGGLGRHVCAQRFQLHLFKCIFHSSLFLDARCSSNNHEQFCLPRNIPWFILSWGTEWVESSCEKPRNHLLKIRGENLARWLK